MRRRGSSTRAHCSHNSQCSLLAVTRNSSSAHKYLLNQDLIETYSFPVLSIFHFSISRSKMKGLHDASSSGLSPKYVPYAFKYNRSPEHPLQEIVYISSPRCVKVQYSYPVRFSNLSAYTSPQARNLSLSS